MGGYQKAITEGHFQSEGHNRRPLSTRRPVKVTFQEVTPLVESGLFVMASGWRWPSVMVFWYTPKAATPPEEDPPPRKIMGPDRKWHHSPPQKEHGTRKIGHEIIPIPVNRPTGVKTLPSRNFVGGGGGGKNECDWMDELTKTWLIHYQIFILVWSVLVHKMWKFNLKFYHW